MSQLFPASPLRAAALAALCAAALPQSALATNGYFSHGYGVKSQAIAGVGIALPQDGLTAATNPAGRHGLHGRSSGCGCEPVQAEPWCRDYRQRYWIEWQLQWRWA